MLHSWHHYHPLHYSTSLSFFSALDSSRCAPATFFQCANAKKRAPWRRGAGANTKKRAPWRRGAGACVAARRRPGGGRGFHLGRKRFQIRPRAIRNFFPEHFITICNLFSWYESNEGKGHFKISPKIHPKCGERTYSNLINL